MTARAEDVPGVYQRNAGAFDATRSQVLFERGWLERYSALLPPGGVVLDLGCGTGRPIGTWLAGRGFAVTGVDAAPAMLALAAGNLPGARLVQQDMRALALGESFDGILSWDAFFHLSPEAQPACLARIAAHLRPGGVLMLTVGPEAGEVMGRVNGEPVYHASLSPEAYRQHLGALGFQVIDFVTDDPDCGGHTVLMAMKRAEEPG
jgi:SAM-dependent methyltransferase